MTGQFIKRGLPLALARDGWWLQADTALHGDTPPPPTGHRRFATHIPRRAPLALLALILAGDFLFWRHDPGLSLALFAALILVAAIPLDTTRRSATLPALILLAAALPVVEHLQTLSLLFLALGLLTALTLLRLPRGTAATALSAATLHLARALPLAGPRDASRALRQATLPRPQFPQWRGLARDWAFPLGGALVLGALLVRANPVLELGLSRAFDIDLDLIDLASRLTLWTGLGLLSWPLLTSAPDTALPALSHTRLPFGLGLNPRSVLRALWTFNALLAVQSVMDISILLGGATLPDGMSHATYAHRGAYPLLATAMLAGAFALAARPFLHEHRALRPLLILWLAQNVALCASSLLRLDLYVDAYGLTYLRIHAMIWMGLVASGLALTAWQILRDRTNLWLFARAATLGLATLYACCFVNFAGLIASHTVTRHATAQTIDPGYLCDLGPMAHAAVTGTPFQACSVPPRIENWREWTFRAWRLAQ